VEIAFGVLQSYFAMVWGPTRWWSKEDHWFILQVCVILHNIIIEDKRDEEDDFNYHQEGTRELTPEDYQNHDPILLEEFLRIHKEIENRYSHEQLCNDLVKHLWAVHSSTKYGHFQLLRSRFAFSIFASSFIVWPLLSLYGVLTFFL
jgi:hypothetical protein